MSRVALPLSLASICFLSACNIQGINPFSTESATYGNSAAATTAAAAPSANFTAAKAIFQNNCVSCHSEFSGYSESDWVSLNYVVPGSPSNSALYQRLKGSNVGGPEDMPQGGQLSSGDLATISTWISQMNASPTPTSSSGPLTAAQRTAAAVQVIQVSCQSCHSVTVTATSSQYRNAIVPDFATFTSDNQFVSSGLVIPQDLADSWLYWSLMVYGSLNEMPQNGSALSASDAATLQNWIDNIGNP